MLIFPRRIRLYAERKVAARKSELSARSSERFFEERRALEAYPPARTNALWRMKGACLTILGLALLGLSYFR